MSASMNSNLISNNNASSGLAIATRLRRALFHPLSRPLGALAGGALGAAFGLRPTLWFAAAAGVLGVLWLVPSPVPKLLELPEEDPA